MSKKTTTLMDDESKQEQYEEALQELVNSEEAIYFQIGKYYGTQKDKEGKVDELLSKRQTAYKEVCQKFDKQHSVVAFDLECRNPITDEKVEKFKTEVGDEVKGLSALIAMYNIRQYEAQQAIGNFMEGM